MSMTDPISDFVTRIRNGIMARHPEIVSPSSKMKVRLAEILQQEGYISGYALHDGSEGHPEIKIRLRWADQRTNAISGLRRCSRPGQRVYVGKGRIPKVRSGLGIAILSTSQGLLTDRAARKLGVGGELICEVW